MALTAAQVALEAAEPVQLQAEEVSEVHWMSLGEIADRADEFTPDSLLAIATWQARRLPSGQK